MKRLILKKIVIISEKNEEAKSITFDDKLTIITGDNPNGKTINRTGKSLVMKSIYYSFGTKLKKYTTNWKSLQINTIVTFAYDGIIYELYRDKDSFILRKDKELKFFTSISELREFYVDFFEFYLKMPIKTGDEDSVYAYPGAIFMPFYIDQDKGWSGSWDSFGDVFSGKWKDEILRYHMGVRTKEYYDLSDEKVELECEQRENKRQLKTYSVIIKNHIEQYEKYLDININAEKFADDILCLTDELNKQLEKKNELKNELMMCFNKMKELEELYLSAKFVYNELIADVDYVENELKEEEIICPICGTVHKNSIENKFYLYSEIEECEKTIQDYFYERDKIKKNIAKQSEELDMLNEYIEKINEILNRKRDKITFKDVVVAEGSKAILGDMQKEQEKLQNRCAFIHNRLVNIKKEQTAISRNGTHIIKDYLGRLSKSLQILNVTDIDSKDLQKFKVSFTSGGNDLPCAILAQVFTLYSIAVKHSKTICAPIVMDAIFQQEPAEEKVNTIWDYVINYQPDESQLILSTTSIHDKKIKGKVISFVKEKGLFTSKDYQMERENIRFYKRQLLKELKKQNNI